MVKTKEPLRNDDRGKCNFGVAESGINDGQQIVHEKCFSRLFIQTNCDLLKGWWFNDWHCRWSVRGCFFFFVFYLASAF